MTARAPEAALKDAVRDTLRGLGVRLMVNAINARGRYRSGLDDGSPDLLLILPPLGCLVGLELKVGANKQSLAQVAWEAEHRRLGGLYYVARSVQEAVEAWGAARLDIFERLPFTMRTKQERTPETAIAPDVPAACQGPIASVRKPLGKKGSVG